MPSDPPAFSRRSFLTAILGAVTAVLAAAAVWPVWRYLAPRERRGEEERVAIPRDQVPVGGAHFFQLRGHPTVVVQRAPGDFLAFSAICTHLGCVIQWLAEKQEFFCPCHAGRFSPEGKVLGGPPPRPLEPRPVVLSGDRILVG